MYMVCQYPYHGENPYDLLEKVQIALEYQKRMSKVMLIYDKIDRRIYHENNIIKDLKKVWKSNTRSLVSANF
ncbi:MAG: hypothetical protein ACLS8D_00615 [Clostridioides difficile]